MGSSEAVSRVFAEAGCTGSFRIERAHDAAWCGTDPDEPVVAASVIKVLIAVEVQRQLAAGVLDPAERVVLRPDQRCPGPVGFSLYQDAVDVSVRDLVVAMLTLSDNAATDALLDRVGIESCNATAVALGLTGTRLVDTIGSSVDAVARAAGFASWSDLAARSGELSPEAEERAAEAMRAAPSLHAETANRTTPGDMCRLLRAIWSDEAADPGGCLRLRRLMGQQLTRDRLAAAFAPPVLVAAKSGGLAGLFRHEVGTITFPDGRRYFAAVFTRTSSDAATAAGVNRAIGRAAAAAVDELERAS